jgi:hypothetical protein
MSAIASFIRIPKTAIEGLRLAAPPPKRKLFETARSTYWDYLRQNGEKVAEYGWSGWVFGPLLEYLKEREQIDLDHSAYDELSEFLTKARGVSHSILTDEHRKAYLERLEAPFSRETLRDYYNEFTATHDGGSGEPMLDGIHCLCQSLKALDDQSVVVFIIG